MYKKRTGNKCDGCAVFFKTSAFALVSSRAIEFKRSGVPLMDRDNVAIIALLRPTTRHARNVRVAVANTHLLFNMKRGDIKLAQLACLFAELDDISKLPPPGASSRKEHAGGATVPAQHCPVILCGDFNCTPFNPLYDFVTKGNLDYCGLSKTELSGQQQFRRSFPRKSLLNANIIPWELGITLTCQKRQGEAGPAKAAETPRQHDESASGTHEGVGTEHAHSSDAPEPAGIAPGAEQATAGAEVAAFTTATCLEHRLQLSSVYDHRFPDGHAEVTTFHDSTSCTVDYILYSTGAGCTRCRDSHGQLELSGKLSLLAERQLAALGGLPSKMLSSDHLSLGAVFALHA